ncbi:glutamine amidotransferase type 1 [Acrasis kona]|uniref:Glutamine amidotransferase type 1 n=1 Tax=Acrasis kona TaxID=1008807 RepID=A0AAW2ZPY9_9EUKA
MIKKSLFVLFFLYVFAQCSKIRIPIGGHLTYTNPLFELYANKTVAFITAAGVTPEEDAVTIKELLLQANKNIKPKWVPIYGRLCKNGAFDPKIVNMVKSADAVYISGGQSGNVLRCLFGDQDVGRRTPLLDAIHEKEVVGGSSAGGMSQPVNDIIITGQSAESYYAVLEKNLYHRKDGLQFFTHGLADVHFAERGRQGRLYVLAFQTQSKLSFGIDEDTGLIQYEDGSLKVTGKGGVLIYDARVQNMTTLEGGVITHFLTKDDRMDSKGKIIFADYKKICTSQKEPESSGDIFTDFRDRSIKVSQYSAPHYVYKGHVGKSRVVEVTMNKLPNTRTACGENGFASFENLLVTVKELRGNDQNIVASDPGPRLYHLDY